MLSVKRYFLKIGPIYLKLWPFKCVMLKTLNSNFSTKITTMPFVTPHLEIFHCKHDPVIPESELYFYFLFYFKCIV